MKRQSPIIRKIWVFGILSGIISLLLACLGFGIVEIYKIKHEATNKLHSQIDILAYTLQAPLLFDDKDAADKIILSLQEDPSIRMVTLTKENGIPFTSFIGPSPKGSITLAKHILYQGKIIGRLEIEAAYSGIQDRYVTYLLLSLLIIGISIPLSYFLSAPIRRQASLGVRQLEQQTHRLRLLANELSETEQRERKRFARLLHDHLQQLLVASKLRLDMMEKKIDRLTVEDIKSARDFVQQAISAARSLTTELRPPVLYEGGLAPALRFLARKFEEQYQFKVHLEVNSQIEPDSDIIKWVFYTATEELLLNVVKYAGVRECFITLDVSEENIMIRVADRGKGFNPEIVDEQKQSGFGLFSIRERIKALGGDLHITSTPGHGATFELSVPFRTLLGEADQRVQKKDLLVKEAMGELGYERSVRILIADDHQIVRQAISSLLGGIPSFKVIAEAEDGEDAVRKAFDLNPEFIIMDLNMPKMNGLAATRIIHKQFPATKIIGLSVQDEQTVMDSMREAGAVAFFNKGAPVDKLIETIKSLSGPLDERPSEP
jgi:signal transduction histidine kinase/ActR/RegA family two-component response regulator